MTYCELCGDEMGYLPFKCKYCGGTFCQKHRLPENHQCSFELKHTPLVPINIKESGAEREQNLSQEGMYKASKDFKKYLKKQEQQRRRAQRSYQNTLLGSIKNKGSAFLIIMIFIMSIAALAYPYELTLSSYSFFNLYLWTFLTSTFVSYTMDYFGLFFLIIMILFFNIIIRNIEARFGTRFLLGLYLFCAFLTGVLYFALWFLLQLVYLPYGLIIVIPFGLASGALLGVISFMIYFNLNREMTFLLFFLPIRMKGRTIILFLVLLNLIPGLLFGISNPLYLIVYLPDLGGILASYLVYYFKFKSN